MATAAPKGTANDVGGAHLKGAYTIVDHTYDVVVVGAGGSGLRATMGAAEAGLRTANISKVFPTRSHTVAAQAGSPPRSATTRPITGPGTCTTPSRVRTGWAIRTRSNISRARLRRRSMSSSTRACLSAAMPTGRSTSGLRRAHAEHGRRPAGAAHLRRCDRTGHAMLHALYQQSLKYDADFFIEYFALDLIMSERDGVKTCVA